MYNGNGTNPVYAAPIVDNNLGVKTYVQMQNNSGTTSLPYAPFRKADLMALNFASEMIAGSWDLDYTGSPDRWGISDLRGSGTFFNNADLGLLLVHGTYGTSFDTTPGRQVKQMYFPIDSGGSAQYLRMSEMSLGGSSPTSGLKWMAIVGCWSLYPQNWNNMQNQNVKPYNSNLHMILGCATDFAAEPLIGQLWADYMLKGKNGVLLTVRDAWYAAANDAYATLMKRSPIVIPNPTKLVVAADDNCFSDYLQTKTNTVLAGHWTIDAPMQVYPPQ
jgi:hypothetical protein